MIEKLKEWAIRMNDNGIPVPMMRDPRTGKGSVTLTMFWISFNVAIVTLAGKLTKVFGDVDYSNVLWLLGLTGSFYMGRRIQGDGKNMTLDGEAPSVAAPAPEENTGKSDPPA